MSNKNETYCTGNYNSCSGVQQWLLDDSVAWLYNQCSSLYLSVVMMLRLAGVYELNTDLMS